jgi:hypothetical protein
MLGMKLGHNYFVHRMKNFQKKIDQNLELGSLRLRECKNELLHLQDHSFVARMICLCPAFECNRAQSADQHIGESGKRINIALLKAACFTRS